MKSVGSHFRSGQEPPGFVRSFARRPGITRITLKNGRRKLDGNSHGNKPAVIVKLCFAFNATKEDTRARGHYERVVGSF